MFLNQTLFSKQINVGHWSSTYEPHTWLGLYAMPNLVSTNYFQWLTLESWSTNKEQIPLHRCQLQPAPYKRLFLLIDTTIEWNITT